MITASTSVGREGPRPPAVPGASIVEATPPALIFNVQRFSIHDGPGIRTTVFFKGCPLRCRWCQNPESVRPRPEIAFFADRCRNTGACYGACPSHAMTRDPERVVRDRCDGCGDCVAGCPHRALETVGRWASVDDLLAQVERDRPFYASSGGGVTLSGGEATLQLPFVTAFVRRCAQKGLDVGLQTCGAFEWRRFAPLARSFSFIHYDLKIMDPGRHRRLTGGGNRIVLANARRLVEAGARISFRCPVIPGCTDDEDNLRALAAFLRELRVRELHLLAYHAMGRIKNERLGRPLPDFDPGDHFLPAKSLRRAEEILIGEGITPASIQP